MSAVPAETPDALSACEPSGVAVAELGVTTAINGDECVLAIAGEIDTACAGEIGDLGVGTLGSHCIRSLVIDMSAVTFMDSSGMGALVRMYQVAKTEGKLLSLRNPSEAVEKVLSLCALDTVLRIESVADVLLAGGAPG
jgi:anti-sigma B factor antagonist